MNSIDPKNYSPDVVELNPELFPGQGAPLQIGRITQLSTVNVNDPMAGMITTVDMLMKIADKAKAKGGNKYGAKRVIIQGEVFDSQKEARRWLELRQQMVHGQISNLERQVSFTLQIGFDYFGERVKPVTYSCDFQYFKDGITYIEDTKSVATMKTESFRIRWRLLQYLFKDSPTVRCVVS